MHLWDIEIVIFSTIISLCNKNGNPNYVAVNGVFWSHYTQLYFWSITMISRLLEIVKMSLNQNVKFDLVSQWNTLTSMSQDVIDNKCKIETVPNSKLRSYLLVFVVGIWCCESISLKDILPDSWKSPSCNERNTLTSRCYFHYFFFVLGEKISKG